VNMLFFKSYFVLFYFILFYFIFIILFLNIIFAAYSEWVYWDVDSPPTDDERQRS